MVRKKKEEDFLTSFEPGEVKRIRGQEYTLKGYVDASTAELRRRGMTPKDSKTPGYLIEQRKKRGRTEVWRVHDEGSEEESILDANRRRGKKKK